MTHTFVLWDIDDTLLYTGGAGSLGMRRAFCDLFGVDDAFGKVEFSGRTDMAIFRDAAAALGIDEQEMEDAIERFIDAYVPHLDAALREMDGALMPGIAELLAELDERGDVTQGLGTGNFRRGGQSKLRHYEIERYFPRCVGGFGEDSHDRGEVIRIGIERLRSGKGDAASRVVVIGDTPHDVAAARTNGAYALAVATGRNGVEELLACGADTVLADLSDIGRAMGVICGDRG